MKPFARPSRRAVVVSAHLALSAHPAPLGRRLSRPDRRRELRTTRRNSNGPSSNSDGRSAVRCECPRGTIFNRERGIAMQAGCRRWQCPACGRRKARKVAARFSQLGADVLMTVSLPRSAWPTPENAAELQKRCRSLLRYMIRHKLVSAYGWVREQGAPRIECVCAPTLQGCACGANGRQLHRHFLLRVPRRDGFRRGWLPWAKLQAAAKRCGLGTLDFRLIFSGVGASA